jgi:hypothetical protein
MKHLERSRGGRQQTQLMYLDATVAKISRQGRVEDQGGEFAVRGQQISQVYEMCVAAAIKSIDGDQQHGFFVVVQWFSLSLYWCCTFPAS